MGDASAAAAGAAAATSEAAAAAAAAAGMDAAEAVGGAVPDEIYNWAADQVGGFGVGIWFGWNLGSRVGGGGSSSDEFVKSGHAMSIKF